MIKKSNVSIQILLEISNLILDHHSKPGRTGRSFHSSMGLLSSAHPRSYTRDSNPGHSVSLENA